MNRGFAPSPVRTRAGGERGKGPERQLGETVSSRDSSAPGKVTGIPASRWQDTASVLTLFSWCPWRSNRIYLGIQNTE